MWRVCGVCEGCVWRVCRVYRVCVGYGVCRVGCVVGVWRVCGGCVECVCRVYVGGNVGLS